ncbi:hypothetical protein CDD83_2339 [Cordyceps sp. RAO-2017]|nr:hypothetical protein CDD83_2339 [Cordyceps sp. RAO-2017]
MKPGNEVVVTRSLLSCSLPLTLDRPLAPISFFIFDSPVASDREACPACTRCHARLQSQGAARSARLQRRPGYTGTRHGPPVGVGPSGAGACQPSKRETAIRGPPQRLGEALAGRRDLVGHGPLRAPSCAERPRAGLDDTAAA